MRSSASELDAMVDCLLGTEPVRPRGILLMRRVLCDPGSPLYGDAPAHELRVALRRALAALREEPGVRT